MTVPTIWAYSWTRLAHASWSPCRQRRTSSRSSWSTLGAHSWMRRDRAQTVSPPAPKPSAAVIVSSRKGGADGSTRGSRATADSDLGDRAGDRRGLLVDLLGPPEKTASVPGAAAHDRERTDAASHDLGGKVEKDP